MRIMRNFAFLAIVVLVLFAHPNRVKAATDYCFGGTISGTGNCSDLFDGIYFFIEGMINNQMVPYPDNSSHGGGCSDYCYYLQYCETPLYCEPRWYDPAYCTDPGPDDWYCICLCSS